MIKTIIGLLKTMPKGIFNGILKKLNLNLI